MRVQWGYSGGTMYPNLCSRKEEGIGGGFKSSMLPRLDTQSVISILSVEILG